MPPDNPQNIHFTKVSHDLVGNYTCEVTSTKGVQNSVPFKLQVIGKYYLLILLFIIIEAGKSYLIVIYFVITLLYTDECFMFFYTIRYC